MELPHWEHGYRCHDYWLGIVRFGVVGLGPKRLTKAARDGYSWLFCPPGGRTVEGRVSTLRAGKLIVEKAYKQYQENKGV